MPKTTLIIDHNDSFIWNIKSWLEPDFKVTLMPYHYLNEFTSFEPFDLVVFSPGPKSPQDYPVSLQRLKMETEKPILGICLGFQMMTLASGGHVDKYFPPKHGKTSFLNTKYDQFRNLKVGRYHSLKCTTTSDFKILAYSNDDQCTMWAEHKIKKQIGFQFHPESFLTDSANLYKQYILNWMT